MTNSLDTLIIHHKPIEELTLKRLLLIFDRVWLIDPIENLNLIPDKVAIVKYSNMTIEMAEYGILYNGENYRKIENRTIDSFDYAYNKGILKVVNLRKGGFFKKYWLPLRLSYDFDTANKTILNKSKTLLKFDKNATISNGIIRGAFIHPSRENIYPNIPESPKLFPKEDDDEFKLSIQLFSIIGKINRSLVVCDEYNLIPTFLNDTIVDIFNTKQEIAKNNSEQKVISEFKKENSMELQNVQYLLHKMSELAIPDEILKEIPVKELIIARDNTFHELLKLRRSLIKNIKFLTKHQFDSSFQKEAELFITKKFEPQLKQYYSKFCPTFQKILNYSSTFTFGSLGVAVSLSQSLSPSQIVFFSGISATVASVISDLPSYISKIKTNKFKNTYGYFLKIHDQE